MLFYGYQTYEDQTLEQFPFNTYGSYFFGWHWHTYHEPSGSEIVAYYSNLLIMQYHNKPKAVATTQNLVTPVVMDLVPQQVQDAFEIGTAGGSQLDMLGEYVGVTRSGIGPDAQPIVLGDLEYTKLIQAAIVRNSCGSSLARIQDLLFQFFPDQIQVFDHETMRLSYFVYNVGISPEVAFLFVSKGLLPRPLGVGLAVVYGSPARLSAFWGCRTYQQALPNNPLNSYDDYQTDWPWLTYADGLVAW